MTPKEKELTTVWITKYALTAGIMKVRAEIWDVDVVRYNGQNFHRNDWHTNDTDAYASAQEMLDDKLASLKKQIAKLENLQIKTITP